MRRQPKGCGAFSLVVGKSAAKDAVAADDDAGQ
jgi:hypothetical protein